MGWNFFTMFLKWTRSHWSLQKDNRAGQSQLWIKWNTENNRICCTKIVCPDQDDCVLGSWLAKQAWADRVGWKQSVDQVVLGTITHFNLWTSPNPARAWATPLKLNNSYERIVMD
jgi:hypothetical protein